MALNNPFELDPTGATSNSNFGGANQAEGCAPSNHNNATRYLGLMLARATSYQSPAISSSVSTNIAADGTGVYIPITGANAINSFGVVAGAQPGAAVIRILEFSSSASLSHGPSLLLNGGLSRKTQPGDVGAYIHEGAADVWRELFFSEADGRTATKSIIRSVTGTDTILASDLGKILDATSGTFTWSITAAATLGAGWWCYVKSSGTGVPTLDPNSSETIDGLTTLPMATTEGFILYCDGSNFKTIGRDRGGVRTASGTTDTITSADNGRIISYTNAAGCAVTMSTLASLGTGFRCTVVVDQATAAVTFTRSGSDVFEGGGTVLTLPLAASDGRNSLDIMTKTGGVFYTTLRQFRSAAQTITAAAQRQVAHGLAAKPKKYWLVLRCTTAELGYSVGDEIIYPTAGATLSAGAAANAGATLRADATNLTLRFGSLAATLNVTRADTGVGANITLGSWEAYLCGEF